jgi:hypothetical protein
MYREEPLNKTLERLQGLNTSLNKRISEVERSIRDRPQNVWHVSWDLRGLGLLFAIGIALSLFTLFVGNRSTHTVVIESTTVTYDAPPPTMILWPRTNWVDRYHPTDYVLPNELQEPVACDGRDNNCPDVPELSCIEADGCHFDPSVDDLALWEWEQLHFGTW